MDFKNFIDACATELAPVILGFGDYRTHSELCEIRGNVNPIAHEYLCTIVSKYGCTFAWARMHLAPALEKLGVCRSISRYI